MRYERLALGVPLAILMAVALAVLGYGAAYDPEVGVLVGGQAAVFVGIIIGAIKNGADFLERLSRSMSGGSKDTSISPRGKTYLAVIFGVSLVLGIAAGPVGPVVLVVRMQEAKDRYKEMSDWLKEIKNQPPKEKDDRWCDDCLGVPMKDLLDVMSESASRYLLRLSKYRLILLSDERVAARAAWKVMDLINGKCESQRYTACLNARKRYGTIDKALRTREALLRACTMNEEQEGSASDQAPASSEPAQRTVEPGQSQIDSPATQSRAKPSRVVEPSAKQRRSKANRQPAPLDPFAPRNP